MQARYIYGVAEIKEAVSPGKVGIGGAEVYTVLYQDLGALVQDSPGAPPAEEALKTWIQTHHHVLELATQRLGTILPLKFGTVVGKDEQEPESLIKDWLKEKLEKVKGRQEFGVQIFYDPRVIGEEVVQTCPEVVKLKAEIEGLPLKLL